MLIRNGSESGFFVRRVGIFAVLPQQVSITVIVVYMSKGPVSRGSKVLWVVVSWLGRIATCRDSRADHDEEHHCETLNWTKFDTRDTRVDIKRELIKQVGFRIANFCLTKCLAVSRILQMQIFPAPL